MKHFNKIAFIFPGQGSQYPGMGKDFFNEHQIAKETFQEADDLLGRKLSTLIFDGPEQLLIETKNSQLGIYVVSMAILRTINHLFPSLIAKTTAGLSLGEYTALTASGKLSFIDGLSLVGARGQFMDDACRASKGAMAVILGLTAEEVEKIVKEVNLPNDLWVANYNCPGQVVISGTLKGIEIGSAAAKAKGAKRVLPLLVHGAFHSGLMSLARDRLIPYIEAVPLQTTPTEIVMNVSSAPVNDPLEIRQNLVDQLTGSVRWEQTIRYMQTSSVDLFIEFGCGKTLAGLNKKNVDNGAITISIEKIADIGTLEASI